MLESSFPLEMRESKDRLWYAFLVRFSPNFFLWEENLIFRNIAVSNNALSPFFVHFSADFILTVLPTDVKVLNSEMAVCILWWYSNANSNAVFFMSHNTWNSCLCASFHVTESVAYTQNELYWHPLLWCIIFRELLCLAGLMRILGLLVTA